jgi:hypothetical protein
MVIDDTGSIYLYNTSLVLKKIDERKIEKHNFVNACKIGSKQNG